MKFTTLFFSFYMSMLLSACSRHVVRQSLSEVERPLVLPAGNWQVSLGAGVERIVESDPDSTYLYPGFSIDEKTQLIPGYDFSYPSLRIGEKVEYFIPAMFLVYLTKNVTTIDSIERITGINSAVVNGISGFAYSRIGGFMLSTNHALLLKSPLSQRTWLNSEPSIRFIFPPNKNIRYDFYTAFSVPVSYGYQLDNQWSCSGGISLFGGYRYRGYDHKDTYDADGELDAAWGYIQKTFDLNISIPLKTTWVFNYHWETSLQIEGILYDENNVNAHALLLFSYTW